jgi:hypothetical protein
MGADVPFRPLPRTAGEDVSAGEPSTAPVPPENAG